MAKVIPAISTSDTFQVWLDRTNDLVTELETSILTASVSGSDETIGNATLLGNFTANTVTSNTSISNATFTNRIEHRTLPAEYVVFGSPIEINTTQQKALTAKSNTATRINIVNSANLSWEIGTQTSASNSSFILQREGSISPQYTFGQAGEFSALTSVTAPTINATEAITAASFAPTTNSGFRGLATDSNVEPSFTWAGDLNTGMFRPDVDNIGFTTNGLEKVRITSNGRVGIGLANPSSLLHVNGNITAAGFIGNLTGNATTATNAVTANTATTATRLVTARTITLTGDVTGSVSFDGSQPVSMATTLLQSTPDIGNYVSGITSGTHVTVSGTPGAPWSPTIAVVATPANTANNIVARDTSGNFSAGTISANLNGNAATATTLVNLTSTISQLNFANTVTGNIQSQLNGKQAVITGAATTITSANLTAARALVSDGSGKVSVSGITSTEMGFLDGVTSNIQTQLNGKQASITGGASSITSNDLAVSRALVSNASGKVTVSTITSTEIGYLDGVTSNIQTQLNGKQATIAIATQSEAEAGTNNTKMMTPLRVSQAITELERSGIHYLSGTSITTAVSSVNLIGWHNLNYRNIYTSLIIKFENIRHAGTSSQLFDYIMQIRLRDSNGNFIFVTTGTGDGLRYSNNLIRLRNGSISTLNVFTDNSFVIGRQTYTMTGNVELFNISNTPNIIYHTYGVDSDGQTATIGGSNSRNVTETSYTLDGVRILMDGSVNLASGRISLYGATRS